MRNASLATFVAALGFFAGCSRASSPTAPVAAPAPVVATPALQTPVLRIIVPPVVPFISTVPLRTEIRTGDTISDCSSSTALWKSSDGDIGVVSYADNRVIAGNGILYTRKSGFLTLTATCDGLTASAPIRVEGTWLPTSITTGDDAPGLQYLPMSSTIEILDGARAGERIAEAQFSTVTGFTFPVTVRLTAPFYAPKDYVIDHTGIEIPHYTVETRIDRTVNLTYVGGASTDTFFERGRGNGQSQDATYPFCVWAAGTIEVGTQWQNDSGNRYTLTTELWCNGQMLFRDTDVAYSPAPGVRFRQSVSGSRACEIRVHRINQPYRITVTYPH